VTFDEPMDDKQFEPPQPTAVKPADATEKASGKAKGKAKDKPAKGAGKTEPAKKN
jgi:hypothetical protein